MLRVIARYVPDLISLATLLEALIFLGRATELRKRRVWERTKTKHTNTGNIVAHKYSALARPKLKGECF